MITMEWVKIGEVVRTTPMFKGGLYARYAVMEFINHDGNRKYKEVFMCSWTEFENVKSQIPV
jgi:hypothetical protein